MIEGHHESDLVEVRTCGSEISGRIGKKVSGRSSRCRDVDPRMAA
jgi:hypothetical protein